VAAVNLPDAVRAECEPWDDAPRLERFVEHLHERGLIMFAAELQSEHMVERWARVLAAWRTERHWDRLSYSLRGAYLDDARALLERLEGEQAEKVGALREHDERKVGG